MKFATRIASGAALLIACLPVQAQPAENPDNVKVQVGSALVCDTQQQVERFVALYDGNVQTTLTAVNGEQTQPNRESQPGSGQANQPGSGQAKSQACDVATIAYVLGPEVSQAHSHGNGTFRVVRVLVLGVLTEQGLLASVPTPLYSAAKVEEVEA
jgi:hypothetical protein